MVEIFRQVRRETSPVLVRNLLSDDRKGFIQGWRGRSRTQHRYRTRSVLDNNFVAGTHTI